MGSRLVATLWRSGAVSNSHELSKGSFAGITEPRKLSASCAGIVGHSDVSTTMIYA
jgi:hypothetical protein